MKSLFTKHLYEFGIFRLDTGEGVLYANDKPVKLTPKAVQTLSLLIEHSGHLVDKEEFFEKIWANTFVGDAVLCFNISELRKTLVQYEGETKYIETVPRRGYRFVPEVHEINDAENEEIIVEQHQIKIVLPEESEEISSETTPSKKVIELPPEKKLLPFALAAMLILLVILSLGAAFFYFRGN